MLETILCDLVPLAKKEILVVNPYVEKCSLCDLIISASQRGLDIKLITQSPATDYEGRRKKPKVIYHNTLKDSDIQVFYNESVHAKLFILDNQVLSASSMNLYSESVAGKLWEAGIVTTRARTYEKTILIIGYSVSNRILNYKNLYLSGLQTRTLGKACAISATLIISQSDA